MLRSGVDVDWRTARFVGSIPLSSAGAAPGARSSVFDSPADGGRNGLFAESDWRALECLRVIAGLRTDYSSFTRQRTAEPRLSAAYKLGAATFTAAAGEYHQVPDPLYFAAGIGRPGVGPMAARQSVLGAQLGETGDVARLELYDKRYHGLVGLSRDKIVADGGIGAARGADVFLRRQLWPYFSTRVTYSYVDSRRTDPDTRLQAPAPFDITTSVTIVGEQALPAGWSVGAALRYATGKPFTPVTGATFDPQANVWRPSYGAPNSERLPPAERADLSLSRVVRRSSRTQLVYFAEIENLFDRTNVYQYTYMPDYAHRIPVRSLFKRSLYVGASLTHTADTP